MVLKKARQGMDKFASTSAPWGSPDDDADANGSLDSTTELDDASDSGKAAVCASTEVVGSVTTTGDIGVRDALEAADLPTNSAATSGSDLPTSVRTFSNQSIHKKPMAPKLINTASHPKLLMSGGAARRPKIDPTCSPENTNATARDRSLAGTTLATISVAAEGATASPSPTAALERHRPGIVAARSGTPQVARDHRPTPAGSTRRPPSLELMIPEGSWQSR